MVQKIAGGIGKEVNDSRRVTETLMKLGEAYAITGALSYGIWIRIHYICMLTFLICQLTAVKSPGKVYIAVFSSIYI